MGGFSDRGGDIAGALSWYGSGKMLLIQYLPRYARYLKPDLHTVRRHDGLGGLDSIALRGAQMSQAVCQNKHGDIEWLRLRAI